MSTIIDELIVTLGLDPKNFKKGTKEVTDAEKLINDHMKRGETQRKKIDKDQGERQRKYAKETERHNKQQIESFNKVKHQLFGIIGAYLGLRSLTNFALKSIFDESALGRLSDVVDMSANKIAAYGLAFKSMGGDAKEASGEILKAQNVLGSLRLGQPSAAAVSFYRYGGQHSDLKSTSSYLLGVSKILQHMQANPRLRASMPYVANQLGIGYNLMQLLKQGPGAVSKIIAQYEKVTNLTREQIKNSEAVQKSMALANEQWAQTGRILLNDVNPYLMHFFDHLKEISDWLTGWLNNNATGIQGAIGTGANFFGWFDPTSKNSGLRYTIGSIWDNIAYPFQQMFNNTHSEAHVGNVNIYTNSSTMHGTGKDLGNGLQKHLAVHANDGMN